MLSRRWISGERFRSKNQTLISGSRQPADPPLLPLLGFHPYLTPLISTCPLLPTLALSRNPKYSITMVPWNPARTKVHRSRLYLSLKDTDNQVQLKLAIQRLRTLQEKKSAMAKKSRREIADLLLKTRVETARLRVEGLIQDDIYVELLELLEVSYMLSLPLYMAS